MTEKRYEYWKNSDTFYDTEIKYGQYFRILDKKEVVGLLNALYEENEQLKKITKEFTQNPTQHNLWKLRTILKDSDVE